MKTKIPIKNPGLILWLFFMPFLNLQAQNEEYTNTYVHTFNHYFYVYGNTYLNENSCWYNPYGQFSLSQPKNPIDSTGCFPNGNSRFNLINIDYHDNLCYYGNNDYRPDLYCDNHFELGPGINGSGSVRVTIKNNDDDAGGIPPNDGDGRSRVEMCYYPKHFDGNGYTADIENEVYYYRWNFFIPNDNSFPDKEVPGGHHIISQFHQVSWVETFDSVTGIRTSDQGNNPVNLQPMQPPLLIAYAHEENAPDNKRNINFLYGFRPDNSPTGDTLDRSSSFKLVDGITKGNWNTIILKIKWSPFDNVGYMQAWVNGQVVCNSPHSSDGSEPNNPNNGTLHPEIIKGTNMNLTTNGTPVSNYMQMGHYRGGYLDTEASIYFDDLIITQDSTFAFSGFNTKLKPEYCDVTLQGNTIEAIPLPKISKYKFKFVKQLDVGFPPFPLIVEKNTNSYEIFDNESYFDPGQNYQVRVAVKVEGETSFRNYSDPCIITIPTQTKLTSEFCNQVLDISNMEIKCYPIPNATNYKFRFSYNGTQTFVNSPDPSINLLDYSFVQPNQTYLVAVRAEGQNFSYSYGESCTITTPYLTKIIDSQCGSVMPLSINNLLLECYPIPNATNYKFRFKDGINTYWVDSNVPSVNLFGKTWFQYDKWYDVQVRAQGANFDFAYGECCSIFIRFKQLAPLHSCGQWNIVFEPKNHEVYPNPFISTITVENAKPVEKYQVFDSHGNIVKSGNFVDGQNIDLPSLKKGLYFLRVYSGEEEAFYKLVKEGL